MQHNNQLNSQVPDGNLQGPVSGHQSTEGALVPVGTQLPLDLHGFCPVPPALATKPTAITLLKALRRRWLRAIAVGAVCALVVAVITYLMVPPPKLAAEARLRIDQVPPKIIFDTGERRAEYETYRRTQVELIRSRFVLNAALRDPKASQCKTLTDNPDPIEFLQSELQTTFRGGAEVLVISLSGDRADDLPIIVNAVRDAYLKEIVEDEQTKRLARLQRLDGLLRKYEQMLDTKRNQLKRAAEGIESDPKAAAFAEQIMGHRLADAQQEVDKTNKELRDLEFKLNQQKARQQGASTVAVPEALVEKRLDSEPAIQSLRQKEAQAQRDVANLDKVFENKNADALVTAKQNLVTAQKNLEERRNQLRPKIEQEMKKEALSNANIEVLHITEQMQTFQALLVHQNKYLADVKEESSKYKDKKFDSSAFVTELTTLGAIVLKVSAEVESLRVEQDAPPRVYKLDDAIRPGLKDDKKPLKMAGVAAAVTFGIVILGLSFLEFRARRIDTPEDVAEGLGIRLVGCLPDWSAPTRMRLFGKGASEENYRKNLLAESVDATRTMLLHAARTQSLRIVMVTSAVGGEGKTSLSSHLAASLARAGRKTLLVDSDMRNPSAHDLFELPLTPGLSDLLVAQATLEDVIRPTQVPGLWMITAGECNPEAIQNLALEETGRIFQLLREQFDFVVVDSCPVLPVADTLLVGQHVDGVLISVMRDVSRMPKVFAAYQRLAMLGIRMLGAVVNGANAEGYGSRYHYYNQPQA